MRLYDAPGKIVEVWAADQLVGRVGDGAEGGGWVQKTLDLPATSADTIPLELRSVGATGAAIANLGAIRAQ
jgi:hypothetical protein